jgi:hypothetical protein
MLPSASKVKHSKQHCMLVDSSLCVRVCCLHAGTPIVGLKILNSNGDGELSDVIQAMSWLLETRPNGTNSEPNPGGKTNAQVGDTCCCCCWVWGLGFGVVISSMLWGGILAGCEHLAGCWQCCLQLHTSAVACQQQQHSASACPMFSHVQHKLCI